TKLASYHALLECSVCHIAPAKHKLTPRNVTPTKPDKREFCGKCHAKGSKKVGVPTVDMDTHGEKYVCWQCHYPHMLGGI
ncbi:MAG TPA: cytochrome c3 family protein, partial [Syntrophales bacterium]|nr:cytochrome c3 family protein [Syntrophales bacterium]